MAKNVKTEPSSLSEWTLEMEVASELKCLFSNVWLDKYPQVFRRRFRLPLYNPFNRRNLKSKLYKLTPIEESKGGGWDTKISVPKGYFRDARSIFIQFKRGYHSDGNNEKNSLFSLLKLNPNPHLEFTFNSNNGNNQHKTLRALQNELKKQNKAENAVMYSFPRIVDLKMYDDLQESILLHTTFLSVNEMDRESPTGIDLGDSNPHFFRTDYKNENRREICSTPFELKGEDKTNDFLFELLSLKLARILQEVRKNERDYERKETVAFVQMILAEFLRINPIELESFKSGPIKRQRFLFKEVNYYYTNLENESKLFHEKYELNYDSFRKRNVYLFNRISELFSKNNWMDGEASINIPKLFTAPIGEGIRIKLDSVPEDFSITSMII